MADAKKPSIEDILAAARKTDGGGGDAPSEPEAAQQSEGSAPPAEKPKAPSKESGPVKKPGQMSVAEMLAAARAEKGGGAPAEGGGDGGASAEEAPAASAAPKKKPGEMSVAEMMAAARGEKAVGKPAAKAAPKAKPAAKAKSAAGASAKAAPKPSGPKDTASILAAARAAAKPGPTSKAEAAKSGQPVESKPAKPGKAPVVVPPMPQKPAYAKATAAKAVETNRRGFFAWAVDTLVGTPLAIGFTTLAVTNLLWLLGLARFMFPNVLTEPPTRFKVGFPGEYAPGMVEVKFKAEFGVWVVRYEYEGEPQIYALKSVCTHLGCTPNWLEAEQKFKCPCHGSGFYKDGINFEGPAPRPLERYAITLSDDGQLEVDKSRTYQEEMGQWADASSYVSV